MKILSITAQKPHSTGSGTYLTELIRSWARAGHSQSVVCGVYPDDDIDFPDGVTCYPVFFTDTASHASRKSADLLRCSCKVKKMSIGALPFPIVGMSDIMPYTSTMYRDLTPEMISQIEESFISAVSRAIEDLDPDLILCHHLFLVTAMVRKHFPDRKVCGLSHGSDLRQAVSCPHLREMIQADIAGLDRIFALHSEQAARINTLYGIPLDKISVIGTGYNSLVFNTDGRKCLNTHEGTKARSGPVNISYAGKMSAAKGIPELLKVIEDLKNDPAVPEFNVTLAGGCKEEPVMEMLTSMADRVDWLGQINQTRLAEVFRSSDIFVLPSFYEGLPLVIIEAMASGAIPVCTDLPGVREWIESNVPDHNVRFIPMPPMKIIDEPTDAGRDSFISDLYNILRELIILLDSGDISCSVPDTGSITWDAVSDRITAS